jgi:hypothetical protein
MRHRGQNDTSETEGNLPAGSSVSLADLMATAPHPTAPAAGKHRAPVPPVIPEQMLPTHDADLEAPAATPVVVHEQDNTAEIARKAALEAAITSAHRSTRASEAATALEIPHTAQWKASHLPRILAGTLLALAVAGTAMLGVRYEGSRASEDFISLAIGLGIVVVLWAVMIASTPQAVLLDGSMLTIRNTSGSETFDLSDGLQAVDVVGDPRTSHWAVLLHRPNATTVVLRRHDVDALEVDTIVRHYRTVATRRFDERQARFSS